METKGIGSSSIGSPTSPSTVTEIKKERTKGISPLEQEKLELKELDNKRGYDVNVSKQAKAMADAHAKALEIAKNTPDVRQDRVAELRRKIKDGSYQVDPGKIADGMLKESVRDNLALAMHDDAKQR